MNHIPRIVLLMTEENIVGREVLAGFFRRNLDLSAILIEKSERAEKEKSYLANNFYQPPSFSELLVGKNIPVREVPKLNGVEAERHLSEIQPDLILLDGSTIIRKNIFSLAKIGAINAHPGLLPEYRGVDSVRWAIYHGDPVGATAHFIDEGLDTGPVLLRREVPFQIGETILQIRVKTMRVCAELMVEAADGIVRGRLRGIPQNPAEGRYFTWSPKEVQEKVEQILRGESQPHKS